MLRAGKVEQDCCPLNPAQLPEIIPALDRNDGTSVDALEAVARAAFGIQSEISDDTIDSHRSSPIGRDDRDVSIDIDNIDWRRTRPAKLLQLHGRHIGRPCVEMDM